MCASEEPDLVVIWRHVALSAKVNALENTIKYQLEVGIVNLFSLVTAIFFRYPDLLFCGRIFYFAVVCAVIVGRIT